jgi:hypothetical protein
MTTQIVTTEVLDLTRTKAPALPIAPVDYSRQYLDQLNNVLRLYFSQLDNFIAQLNAGATSTVTGLRLPYGAFQDSTTQTAANTTTAYPITFNTTDFSNGVTMVSGSRFTVANAGIYNLQFSIQLENLTTTIESIDIWFRKNGTDIPASNSRFGVSARKGAGNPSHLIAGLNYFIDMQANDYVELVWCTTDVLAKIVAYAAGTSPTRPSIPSVIATMTFVSALPT